MTKVGLEQSDTERVRKSLSEVPLLDLNFNEKTPYSKSKCNTPET